MRPSAAIRYLNGVNVSKMAVRPSVSIPAVVVPSPQQSFLWTFSAWNAWSWIIDTPVVKLHNRRIFLWERWTIIHGHLHFRKVGVSWVPWQLSAFDWHRRVEGCSELKERFEREGQDFLDRIITCDETWVHHFTPKSKQASKQWKHADSPPPKNFRAIAPAGKVMAFSSTNVALFTRIFYPVVPLSTVNITVVLRVMCIRVCGKKAWFGH